MSSMGFINNSKNLTKETSTLVPIEFTHSCAIGQTGCGKTTSYIYPNLENRIKENHSIIMFDYKGKEHNSTKYFADKYNKLKDVIEIGKPWGKSINIIKYMTKSDLENFLTELYGLQDSENKFWGTSAVNISLVILDVIDSIEKIVNNTKEIKTIINFKSQIKKYNYFDFPVSKNLYELSQIMSSLKNLKDFLAELDDFGLFLEFLFEKEIKEVIEKIDKYEIVEIYSKLKYLINDFKNIANSAKKSLDAFGNMNEVNVTRTIQSILISINVPLLTIANKKWLNNDKFDIIESINNKNIIIINTQSFSSNILSSFSKSLFVELTKRITQSNKIGVSVFADEAQRILSKNFELPVDVLREAKVELFLAFQNSELMIESLGENKYLAFLQNLKSKFIYKNMGHFNDIDTSKFNTFEYTIDENNQKEKTYISKSFFIETKELFDVELKYQRELNVHESLGIKNSDFDKVILFNEQLFEKNIVILQDEQKNTFEHNTFDLRRLNAAKKSILDLCNEERGIEISKEKDSSENSILKLFGKKSKKIKKFTEDELPF